MCLLCQSHLPAVRTVTGVFAGIGNGVKIRAMLALVGSSSPKAHAHKKKAGVTPRKGASFE